MKYFGEYSTIADTRSRYLGSGLSGDDDLLLTLVRQVSREIDRISGRQFFPIRSIRKFDVPKNGGYDIFLDAELLEVISVTNGDGNVFVTADLILKDANRITKTTISLPSISGTWMPKDGISEQAIYVDAVWCDVFDVTAGWSDTAALAAGISGSDTSFNSAPSLFDVGQIIRIDDEFMYVSSIVRADATLAIPTTVDAVTVIRAINGTTAAAHLLAAVIKVWNADYSIQMLTAAATAGYYHLKSNPTMSTFTTDGVVMNTPQNISKFIRSRLSELKLLKLGFA